MEIGQKIKKMRKEAGISQEELAFAIFGVLTAVGVVLMSAFAISRAVKRRKA